MVVDPDLEKFFDKVNHDVLMARVKRKISDKRLLYYIRQMLKAGVIDERGIRHEREEGTPQGGPLSPLLANVLLKRVYAIACFLRDEGVKDNHAFMVAGAGKGWCRFA